MKNTLSLVESVKAEILVELNVFIDKCNRTPKGENDNERLREYREDLRRNILNILINRGTEFDVQTKIIMWVEYMLRELMADKISSNDLVDIINEQFGPEDHLTDEFEEKEEESLENNKVNIMDKVKDRETNTRVDLIDTCKTELEALVSTLDRFNNIESTEVTEVTIDTMLPEYIIGLYADEQEILKATLCEYKMWLETKVSSSEEGKLGDHNILGALINAVYTTHQLILFANKFTDPTTAVEINKETEICIKCIREVINLEESIVIATELIHQNPFVVNDMILSTSLCVDLIINILSNIKSSITIVSNAGINLAVFSKMITVCTTLNNYILDNVDFEYEE